MEYSSVIDCIIGGQVLSAVCDDSMSVSVAVIVVTITVGGAAFGLGAFHIYGR